LSFFLYSEYVIAEDWWSIIIDL